MKSSRSNIMITLGERKYFYDSQEEVLNVYTQSGKLINQLNVTKEAWEIDPEEWDKLIESIQEKRQLNEKELSELAEALHKATDWKEARQIKREEERREREKQET